MAMPATQGASIDTDSQPEGEDRWGRGDGTQGSLDWTSTQTQLFRLSAANFEHSFMKLKFCSLNYAPIGKSCSHIHLLAPINKTIATLKSVFFSVRNLKSKLTTGHHKSNANIHAFCSVFFFMKLGVGRLIY